jgi:hypothetical protein
MMIDGLLEEKEEAELTLENISAFADREWWFHEARLLRFPVVNASTVENFKLAMSD